MAAIGLLAWRMQVLSHPPGATELSSAEEVTDSGVDQDRSDSQKSAEQTVTDPPLQDSVEDVTADSESGPAKEGSQTIFGASTSPTETQSYGNDNNWRAWSELRQLPATPEELKQQAAAVVDRLVASFPESADAWEAHARIQYLIGDTAAAEESWQRAIAVQPTYAYAHHGLGLIAAKRSEYEVAEQAFRKALESIDGMADTIHELSDVLLKQAKIDDAIELLREHLEKNENSTETAVRLGNALLAKRDYPGAQAAFESALRQVAEIPKAEQGLATALMRQGERDKARELLTRIKARPPRANRTQDEQIEAERSDVADRYEFVARVYMGQNQLENAIGILWLAGRVHPPHQKSRVLAVTLLQRIGDLAGAYEVIGQLCKLEPKNPSFRITQAMLASRLGKVDAALAGYDQVTELAPRSPEAFIAKADLLIQIGRQFEEARRLAEQAVQLRGNAFDYAVLGRADAALGDLESANKHMSLAVEKDPKQPMFRDMLEQIEKAKTR